MVRTSLVVTPQVAVRWASWDTHRASRVEGSPASLLEVLGTMTGVGGPNYLGGSATAGIRAFVAKMTAVPLEKVQNSFGSNTINLPILSPSALVLSYPCL